MPFERVAPEMTRNVILSWKRPIPYEEIIENGSPHDSTGWLYMILGYHGSSHPKLFYLGKVYHSHVSSRLRNADHKRRYVRLRNEHSRHSFRVSLGAVEIKGGRITSQRIDQIETMLIYTASVSQPLERVMHFAWAKRLYTVGAERAYAGDVQEELQDRQW